jgi:hypothetical protein
MSNKQTVLQTIIPLSEEQRLEARDRARQNVVRAIGQKPQWKHYQRQTVSEYPTWLPALVAVLLTIVFVAAGAVSVFRTYTAGSSHFADSMATYFQNDQSDTPMQEFTPPADTDWQAAIVGLSAFVMAEFMVIASVVAANIFFVGRARWLMAVPAALGTAVALVGNWTVAQPSSTWGYLETVVPPIGVLFMALIGERLILRAIKQRHADRREYQKAQVKWDADTAKPEQAPRWRNTYATALRDTLQVANSRGRGSTARKEFMATMTRADWRLVVHREMQADDWFEGADFDPFGAVPQQASPPAQTAPTPVTVEAPPQPQTPAPVVTTSQTPMLARDAEHGDVPRRYDRQQPVGTGNGRG